MTEIRNVAADLARFRRRVFVIGAVVLVCFGLLCARLGYLQVVRHEDLAEQAESNRTAIVPVVPNRGLILDRNGITLASNYSAYTLEITPSKAGNLEDTIDALTEVLEISPRDRRRFKRLREDSRSFDSVPIRTRLSDEEVARFAAQRYRFPGVEIKARLFRNYPHGELASHVLGYIGRINQAEKTAMEDWEDEDLANYKGTEYIGKLGIERATRRRCTARPASSRWKPRPAAARCAGWPPIRRRPATRSCCRSTSSCRSWSRTCLASVAARWSRSTPRPARCWPS